MSAEADTITDLGCGRPAAGDATIYRLTLYTCSRIQLFDAVGWAAGRASGL